jgi:hypothetical protein
MAPERACFCSDWGENKTIKGGRANKKSLKEDKPKAVRELR